MKCSVAIFFLILLILSMSQDTFAALGNFKFAKSKETTSEDIPLDFTPEKTEYKRGKLKIWGSVRNKLNSRPYEYVKVTFSLWGGRGGDLIAREYTYTTPSEIGPG